MFVEVWVIATADMFIPKVFIIWGKIIPRGWITKSSYSHGGKQPVKFYGRLGKGLDTRAHSSNHLT